MTTSQPGQNSEDFLRALLKRSPEDEKSVVESPAEHGPDEPAEDDDKPS